MNKHERSDWSVFLLITLYLILARRRIVREFGTDDLSVTLRRGNDAKGQSIVGV